MAAGPVGRNLEASQGGLFDQHPWSVVLRQTLRIMIYEPTFNRPSLYQSGPSNLFHRGAVYDNAQLKPGTGTFVCMTYIATPLAQTACLRVAIGSSDVTFKMELKCECVLR